MPVFDHKDFKKLLNDVKSGKTVPVYLFWGERYLCQSAMNELIAGLLPDEKRSPNLHVMDGQNQGVFSLVERVRTFPLFGGRQVFVARDVSYFDSKSTAGKVFARSYSRFLKGDKQSAARILLEAISLSEMTIDDIRGEELPDLPDEKWEKHFGVEKSNESMAWLQETAGLVVQSGMQDAPGPTDGAALLLETINRGMPSSNHLIMLADTVDKKKELFRAIEKVGAAIRFSVEEKSPGALKRGQDNLLKELIRERLGRQEMKIDADAEFDLIGRIGFNPALLANTLEKLISHAGDDKTIRKKHIESVVRRAREEPLYELTGAVSQKNTEAAIMSLNLILEQGYAPLQVLASLTKHVRRLLVAKWLLDGELESLRRNIQYDDFSKILPGLKKDSKLPKMLAVLTPYPLFLLFKHAGHFEMSHLMEVMSDLMHADTALKSGAPLPRIVLEDLIFKCTGVSNAECGEQH
ncbi:MAG: hypothetical protein V1736_10095 [Pseudomonadota bacterium]